MVLSLLITLIITSIKIINQVYNQV